MEEKLIVFIGCCFSLQPSPLPRSEAFMPSFLACLLLPPELLQLCPPPADFKLCRTRDCLTPYAVYTPGSPTGLLAASLV